MEKQSLGTVIAALRKAHGMTQLELAKKMNVTDKAVSKWERGLACPDVNSLPHLAEVLGVSVGELMQANIRTDAPRAAGQPLTGLILRAIALAMGTAVVVLSALNKLDLHTGFEMLGIGLACISLSLFQKGIPD